MIYEKEFENSINMKDFNEFKDLIENYGIDPFAYEMEYVELCIETKNKFFLEYLLTKTELPSFNPNYFLSLVTKPEYTEIAKNVIEKHDKKINYEWRNSRILKTIIQDKNEELLIFLIKNSTAFPFSNHEVIVDNIVRYNLSKALLIILPKISILNEHLFTAARSHCSESFLILLETAKERNLKINYKNIFICYFSNIEELNNDVEIIKSIIDYIEEKEAIRVLTVMEYTYAFKYLLERILKKEENYFYLNNIFKKQVLRNNPNNVKYLLEKSNFLLDKINSQTWQVKIKNLIKKETLNYLYTEKDIREFLKNQSYIENALFELFKDKNLQNFINKKKVENKIESNRLKQVLSLTCNINNF